MSSYIGSCVGPKALEPSIELLYKPPRTIVQYATVIFGHCRSDIVVVTILSSCTESCSLIGQFVRVVHRTFSSSGERILVATGDFVSRVVS